MADAPMPFLGLSARRGDHVSAGIRVDLFWIGAERSNDVRDVSVRVSCRIVQNPNGSVVVFVSRTRCGSGDGPRRRHSVAVAADARSGSPGSSVLQHGFLSTDPAHGNFSHRARLDYFNDVTTRKLL